MATHFANYFTIQITDTVRLIFEDQRPSLPSGAGPLQEVVGEMVMSPANARQLRDLLVQYVKDDDVGMDTVSSGSRQ